jgi:hypothetical protein
MGRIRIVDTSRLFALALAEIERGFRLLEKRVPPPVRIDQKDSFIFRYREQTIHQAVVQKLARLVSGLHALTVLHHHGLFQEQGLVQRAVDELQEDITFLSIAIIRDDMTDRHKKYLEYFYAEEWDDPSDVVGSHKSRGMVSRDKIRAYVNSTLDADQSRANVTGKVITKAYSGFVHAASPHIMDMVWGEPPRFDVCGETAQLATRGYDRDALNYFYRALISTAVAAIAFGEHKLVSELEACKGALEKEMN